MISGRTLDWVIVTVCGNLVLMPHLARAQARELAEAQSVRTMSSAPAASDDTQPGSDPERSRSLFFEAKVLYEHRRVADACERLQQSLALNPTLGALLNLGRCNRELGKLVTAHDYYRRAEVLATLSGDTKRQDVAHSEAAQLAPLRATLSLQLPGGDRSGLEVQIDRVQQPPEVWSGPMFIDGGVHEVTILWPRREPFRDHVRVHDGDRAVLVVPDLQRPSSSADEASTPPTPESAIDRQGWVTTQSSEKPALVPMQVASIAVGAAGVVTLGVGLVFGQLAKNANDRSQALCAVDGRCTDDGFSQRRLAIAHASRSTVLTVVGAAAAAAGVTMWLVAPTQESRPQSALALRLSHQALTAELTGSY